MRLQDLAAGDDGPLAGAVDRRRRAMLQGLAALGGLGWAALGRGEESRHLIPGASYPGARLIQRPNEAGFPDLAGGGIGTMTQFVFPVAVAVTPMRDIYVADAGLAALFRLDPMLGAMNQIRSVRIGQQTRLAAAADGSVVVASGSAAPVVRVARSGRVVQTIDAQPGGGSFYDEIAVDPNSGRYYGLDKVQRRLEEVMPQGRGAMVLPQGLLPELPAAMAIDGERVYVAGRGCQCLVAIDTFGSRNMEIVAEDVGQAVALAAGDGWLALADGRDRVLRVWRQGALLVESEFAALGLLDPRGLAIAQRTLYVADGAGRRVASFGLRA